MTPVVERRRGPADRRRRVTPDMIVDDAVRELSHLKEHPDPEVRLFVTSALVGLRRLIV